MPGSRRGSAGIIDDFVDTAFDGTTDPDGAVVAGWIAELPAELPEDPTAEQLDAWLELAELVAGEEFAARRSAPWCSAAAATCAWTSG